MKPGDFFFGVTDFFSVLLPGAALTFIARFLLGQVEVPPDHLLHVLLELQSTEAWAAFGLVSYVMGHLIASLGAQLDTLYDNRKGSHRNPALKRLADRIAADFRERIQVAPLDTPRTPGRPSLFARLVDAMLAGAWGNPKETAASPVNAYKLARLTLSIRAPTIYTDTVRLEADSKFFRSLSVVAAFAVVACVVQLATDLALMRMGRTDWTRPAWGAAYLVFVFTVLRIAFARFCELRLKATETAFQGLLVVTQLAASARPLERLEAPASDRDA